MSFCVCVTNAFMSLQNDDVIYVFGLRREVMKNTGYFRSCKTSVFFSLTKAEVCSEELKKATQNMEESVDVFP